MTSITTSGMSLKERRLEAELEEQRVEKMRLQHDLIAAKARSDVFENKAKRFQEAQERAEKKQEQLEDEILKLRQAVAQAQRDARDQVASLVEQFDVERLTLKGVLEDAEKRAEESRRLERRMAAELQAVAEELEEERKKKNAAESEEGVTTAAKKKKRSRRTATKGDDEEEEDDDTGETVSQLKRRVRELELEKEALEKGVAITQRTEELVAQLSASERRERLLQERISLLEKDRRQGLEFAEKLNLVELQLRNATEEVERLLKTEAKTASLHAECERWRTLVKHASTPSEVSKFIADLERENASLTEAKHSARAEKDRLESEVMLVKARVTELEATLASAQAQATSYKKHISELEETYRSALGQRDAAERVLKLVPVVGKDGGEEMAALKERVDFLTDALEKARQGEKEAVQAAERVTSENERLVRMLGQGAFDPSSTRVLHIKPTMRADFKPVPVAPPPATPAVATSTIASTTAVDADGEKRTQRLKEMFREQIRLYKEAVFLLFGWKLEMTPDDKPQLRLKSMYAETADDFLLFRMIPNNSTLELLDTDYGRRIPQSLLMYLSQCDSPPAFLSALSLELFSNQTRAM